MKSSSRLRTFVRFVLTELYTPQKTAKFYHRSFADLDVGDVLTSTTDPKTGKHWLADKSFEQALEEKRKESYPDRPSRLDCVYASLVPHSRFLGKGRLFVVEPVDCVPFVSDSLIIDKLGEQYREEYNDYTGKYEQPYVSKDDTWIKWYWEGVDPKKSNLPNMEVLMTKARVVEVVDEKKRGLYGDTFTIGSGVYFDASTSIWGMKGGEEKYVYKGDGNTTMSLEHGLEVLKKTPGIEDVAVAEKKNSWDDDKITFKLVPGFTSKLTKIYSSMPGEESSHKPSFIGSFPSSQHGESVSVMLDRGQGEKFMKLVRAGKIELSGGLKTPRR